jgi:hypothetical protein
MELLVPGTKTGVAEMGSRAVHYPWCKAAQQGVK